MNILAGAAGVVAVVNSAVDAVRPGGAVADIAQGAMDVAGRSRVVVFNACIQPIDVFLEEELPTDIETVTIQPGKREKWGRKQKSYIFRIDGPVTWHGRLNKPGNDVFINVETDGPRIEGGGTLVRN